MLANSYNRFRQPLQPLSKILMQYSKSIPNPTVKAKMWLFHAVWTYLLIGLVAGMLLTPNVPLQRNCLEGRTQWYIRGIDAETIFVFFS